MARIRERPDLSDAGNNPLVNELSIVLTRKDLDVTNKFGDADVIRTMYESVRYTKVYEQTGASSMVSGLTLRAKELYLYIMYALDHGEDLIWIHKARYMERHGINSVNTFKEAVRDLSQHTLIYPHAFIRDVYWINPHFFFKGDRKGKYPSKVNVKKEI